VKVNLYNQNAENIGTVELNDGVFAVPINRDLLQQVVTSQLSNSRQILAHAKGRGEVRGGGKKPWRQKGTGRARHGSIRSPIWKGGGATFGPTKERNFKKKINRKMAKLATAMVLSSKVSDKEIVVIDTINLEQWKTKKMAEAIKKLSNLFEGKMSSALVITPKNSSSTIFRAVRNLPNIDVIEAKDINALKVISRKNIFILKDAVDVIQKTVSK
jgi:large subunit ribosomal protein L4